MVKFKIIFGNNSKHADVKFNEWLKAKGDIKIVQMQYQHSGYGDHSICIMYEE